MLGDDKMSHVMVTWVCQLVPDGLRKLVDEANKDEYIR